MANTIKTKLIIVLMAILILAGFGFGVEVLAEYCNSGDFTSSAIDTGQSSTYTTLDFSIVEPANTDLKFQLRSASTEGGLSGATWYGPTGVGDYYTTSGTAINSTHNTDRWIQYKAFFSTSDSSATPTLQSITINHQGGFIVDNTGFVGIGTSSPGSRLDVFQSSSETALTVTQSGTGDIINVFDGSTEIFTILNGGNVGIGVADPDTTLEVYNAGTQLKLSYDGTNYSTFATDIGGDLTINASGGDISLGDENLTTTGTITAGNLGISASGNITMADDTWIGLASDGGRIVFDSTPDPDTLTINTADLLFSADNTYNIGASGATRPATGYFGTSVYVGGTLLDADELTASGALTVQSTGADLTLTNVTSGNIAITSLGNLTETFASGSTYDLKRGAEAILSVDANGAIAMTPTSGQDLSVSLATTGDFVVNTNDFFVDTSEGNIGIGLAAPGRRLDVLDATASTPQMRLTNDSDTYGEFYVDATGDLSIGLTDGSGGDDIIILDENLKVCTGGSFGSVSCPAFTITGTGNLIVEDELYVGADTSNYIQASGSGISYAGTAKPKRSIILTASGGITPGTAGAAQTKVDGTNHTYYVLDFDASSDEATYWQWAMPDSYDDGTIDITYYWEAAATSGDVVWCFQAKGLTANNAEDIDSALSSAVCETDTAQGNANDLASVTESGATSNFAKGEYIAFKVFRDADNGSDTMTGDARLVKVKIEYSVSAESD